MSQKNISFIYKYLFYLREFSCHFFDHFLDEILFFVLFNVFFPGKKWLNYFFSSKTYYKMKTTIYLMGEWPDINELASLMHCHQDKLAITLLKVISIGLSPKNMTQFGIFFASCQALRNSPPGAIPISLISWADSDSMRRYSAPCTMPLVRMASLIVPEEETFC